MPYLNDNRLIYNILYQMSLLKLAVSHDNLIADIFFT